MKAPQIIMIATLVSNITMNLIKHGENKNEKYNVWIALIASAIEVTLLWCGGFFG